MPSNFSDSNVARLLTEAAKARPDQIAIAEPKGYHGSVRRYKTVTFHALDEDSDHIAAGLAALGVQDWNPYLASSLFDLESILLAQFLPYSRQVLSLF